jgi:beta-galactosidase
VKRHPFFFSIASVLLLALTRSAPAATPAYTWIEGESPASSNMTIPAETSEHPEWLSGGKWLRLAVEPNDVNTIPADGIDLTYNFSTTFSGNSKIWARMGFESARPEFDWRIDDADWQHIDAKNLCTDLMELSFFTEVEWLHLGDQNLSAGAHKLELRIPRQITNGKPQRLLFAADCFCISSGPFQPNSKFKPDEDSRTDADRAAEANVFHLPASTSNARVTLPLKGAWQICRDDEVIPAEVDQPMKDLPTSPVWSAIEVPGNKADVRPDLTFAHRVWYRAHIDVPAASASHSFTLNLPEVNLNATVFVNGTYCGFAPFPFAHASIDITKAIKPGQVNEVAVGVRDAWYAYYRDPKNPTDMRRVFVYPVRILSSGFQDFVYPIWNHSQSGLLETPTLIVAGSTYASDVFVKPSVSNAELAADVTVQNSSSAPATGDVLCEAIDPKSQQVAKSLPPVPFTIAAGEQQVVKVSAPWPDARLWWPDPNPALYTLRTTILRDDQSADVSDTPFGFREWSWEGHDFKLNGIVWHGWADVTNHPDLFAWLNFYRKTNQRFFRFWAPNKFFGMDDDTALDWFDRNGIVIRRTGVFDGESMGYERHHIEELSKNAVAQEEAKIRGERNHPSIMIWSLENEMSFIDAFNLNWDDDWEKSTASMWQTIHTQIDPTRPVMVDGGGAGKANMLPVAGDHYIVGDPAAYPKLATNPTTPAAVAAAGYGMRSVRALSVKISSSPATIPNSPPSAATSPSAAKPPRCTLAASCGKSSSKATAGRIWVPGITGSARPTPTIPSSLITPPARPS